eukprot:Pgem_evm1s16382
MFTENQPFHEIEIKFDQINQTIQELNICELELYSKGVRVYWSDIGTFEILTSSAGAYLPNYIADE